MSPGGIPYIPRNTCTSVLNFNHINNTNKTNKDKHTTSPFKNCFCKLLKILLLSKINTDIFSKNHKDSKLGMKIESIIFNKKFYQV